MDNQENMQHHDTSNPILNIAIGSAAFVLSSIPNSVIEYAEIFSIIGKFSGGILGIWGLIRMFKKRK